MIAYMFRAALLCEDCAAIAMIERREYEGAEDSDAYPQGPYGQGGGEADCPQHCDSCGLFLENPLTADGQTYVRDAFREYVETGRGNIETLADWKLEYPYDFDDFADIGVESMREDKPLTSDQIRRLEQLESI